MTFTNDPTDARLLIATDYWESPAALAGKPVLSYSDRCFRLVMPVKSVIGAERYAQLAIVLTQIENCQYPAIDGDSSFAAIQTGSIRTLIPWTEVFGITHAEFPEHSEACDFAVYLFAGKRGPRCAFRRKATMQAVPF